MFLVLSFVCVRRLMIVKELRMSVVLVLGFSLIEIIALVIFTIKIVLMEHILTTIIAGIILGAYILL